MSQLTHGIGEVAAFLGLYRQNAPFDRDHLTRLEETYRAVTRMETMQPLEIVFQDALCHLMGEPETSSMAGMRLALDACTGDKLPDTDRMRRYFKDRGVTETEGYLAIGMALPLRGLITAQISTRSLEQAAHEKVAALAL